MTERGTVAERAATRAQARPAGSGLLPREHGAYAQLAFPLLTGLAYARFHTGAIAFGLAAVALFLLHEPAAVLTGMRGARLKATLGDAARRALAFRGGSALLATIAAIGLAPGRAWVAALVPALLAAAVLPLFGTRAIKSVLGEVLVAAAFAAIVLPVALSGLASVDRAGIAAGVWFAAHVPPVLAVHAVKARHLRRAERPWAIPATPISATFVALAAGAAAVLLPYPATVALAVLPPAIGALVVGLRLPHPRNLKRIGWTMVGADTLALVLLLIL